MYTPEEKICTEVEKLPFWENVVPLFYNSFHITHGQLPYVAANLPPGTTEAYPLDTNQLSLTVFPLIEDFQVLLIGEKEKLLECRAIFISPSHGRLAHFLFGEYTVGHMQQEDFTIPMGTFTTPYHDFDQGWIILLVADETFVYIMTGFGLDEPYTTWFKVKKKRYYEQWQRIIQFARSKNRA